MSRIDDLIQELAPTGVQYSRVDEVAVLKRGTAITKKSVVDGPVPVIAGGRTPAYFHNESNRAGENVVIAGSGAYAGFVSYWSRPIYVSDAFTVVPKDDRVSARYLYFWLQSQQELLHSFKSGGGVPHVYPRSVSGIRIPVPPLEVQREIVRVLDKFTQLEAELEAELEARRVQYEHYRHSAVGKPQFANNKWVPLASIADIHTGVKPDEISEHGAFPYINAGIEPSGFTNRSNSRGNVVTIPSRGQGGAGHVGYQRNDFWCGPLCYRIESKSRVLLTRFLYFYLRNVQDELVALRKTGSIPAVNKSDLGGVLVPVVPVQEQQRVVKALDKFDALVNDISIGLPAELNARRQQYEYYRDRLLTFKEAV